MPFFEISNRLYKIVKSCEDPGIHVICFTLISLCFSMDIRDQYHMRPVQLYLVIIEIS